MVNVLVLQKNEKYFYGVKVIILIHNINMQTQTQTRIQSQHLREKWVNQFQLNLLIKSGVTLTPTQRKLLLTIEKDKLLNAANAICVTNNITLC